MKKLLFFILPALLFAGCNTAQDKTACLEQCKQEIANELSTKEKCRNAGEKKALELQNELPNTHLHSQEYFYSKKTNSCILAISSGKIFEDQFGIQYLYDSFTGELIAQNTYYERGADYDIERVKEFNRVKENLKTGIDFEPIE